MENHQSLIQEELNDKFTDACKNGDLKEVKYLLTSPELREHADIHAFNDYGFKWASLCNNINIVEFLIFDMDIEKTDVIKELLENKVYQEIKGLFNMRELNKQLENELKVPYNKKKNKI